MYALENASLLYEAIERAQEVVKATRYRFQEYTAQKKLEYESLRIEN